MNDVQWTQKDEDAFHKLFGNARPSPVPSTPTAPPPVIYLPMKEYDDSNTQQDTTTL